MSVVKEQVSKLARRCNQLPLALKLLLGKKTMATYSSPIVSKLYYVLENFPINGDVQKTHSEVMAVVNDLSVNGAEIFSTISGITYYDVRRLLTASTLGSYGMVLTMIAKYFAPKTVLELGTCIGVSAMYLAGGLESATDLDYSLFTIEASEALADIARENMRKFGVDDKRWNLINDYFENALPVFLRENASIDFVFVDGSHTYESTLKYFNWLIPNMKNDGIMMFDDIRWSHEMFKAWNDICTHGSIKISVDLGGMGLCIVQHDPTKHSQKHFSFPIS